MTGGSSVHYRSASAQQLGARDVLGWQRTGLTMLLLVCSGGAALIYQVLWAKQLSLVLGVDIYAVTMAISAFFLGMAFGGYILGRLGDRIAHPFKLYALLEAGIAVLGLATTLALAHAAAPFAALEAVSIPLAWGLCLVVLAAAPFLIGGTTPVVMRAIGVRKGRVGSAGGWLYSVNTAGAIAGALVTPFVLIPTLGVQRAAVVAVALNLVAGLGAVALMRTAPPANPVDTRRKAVTNQPISADTRAAIILYGIAGGIALSYEVVWTQVIIPFMSTRSFAFAVILATYLAALATGSALFARRADRLRDPWSVFGLLIALAGLSALVSVALLGPWIAAAQSHAELAIVAVTNSDLAGISARFAVAAICVIFIPTLLLGAAFPVVLRIAADTRNIGRDVGTVISANIFGGIIGTILTGLVLVPALGLVRTLSALAVAAATVGLFAALRGDASKNGRWHVGLVGAAIAVVAIATPTDRLASLLTQSRRGTLVKYDESRGGTVAVLEQTSGQNRFRRLYIQGVSNSGDAMPSLRYMRLQALLPLILHSGEPRSALVIGFGTGITAGALLRYPGLDQRVVAELLPAVVRAGSEFKGNYDAATSPALHIRLRDGRRELLQGSAQYDLITLEPPPPSAAGVANLYSSDFYRLASSRSRDKGLVAQWLPIATQNDADTRSLVRSFVDVFPYASLWTTEFHEMLMIGSLQPIEMRAREILKRFAMPGVSEALSEVGVVSAAALLATYVTDRDGLVHYAGAASPVTDDRPLIEYASWVGRRELVRTLPNLLALQADPPLYDADDVLRNAIATERENLMTFYRAGLSAYNGERQRWAREMLLLKKQDGENPYYRWFMNWGNQ